MKSLLKVGVLAIALGMFVASCNSGTNSDTNGDSSNIEMSAPAPTETAPVPADSMVAPADSATGTDTSM